MKWEGDTPHHISNKCVAGNSALALSSANVAISTVKFKLKSRDPLLLLLKVVPTIDANHLLCHPIDPRKYVNLC